MSRSSNNASFSNIGSPQSIVGQVSGLDLEDYGADQRIIKHGSKSLDRQRLRSSDNAFSAGYIPTSGTKSPPRMLLPAFDGEPEVIRERKSSLSNISVAPLNIQIPKWRDPFSNTRLQEPPSPKNNRSDSIDFGGRKKSFNPISPRTPRRINGQTRNYSVTETPSEPDTPNSTKLPSFGSSDGDTNEVRSVASLNSPPSLSHSLRLSDVDSLKRMERMRQKHNCIRELYNTEWQYAQDMAVIVRIYMCGSADLGLSVRQIDRLFSNISQILDVSLSVVAILESHIPPQILHGNGVLGSLDIVADKELRVGRAMCLALSGQLYEVYESYIHRSKEQSDTYYAITSPFQRHPQKVNNASPGPNIDETKLAAWLNRCKSRASKFTTAWSLDSLLIKPVQRLGKYPLFLKTLLDNTDPSHMDYEDSERAFNRSKHFLDCVNARFGLEDDAT